MQSRLYIAAGVALSIVVVTVGYLALHHPKKRGRRIAKYDPTAPLHGARGSKKRKSYEKRLDRERATLEKEERARPGVAACSDGQKNFDETDVDCGGSVCGGCDNARVCRESGDCKSGFCDKGTCAPWASAVACGSGFSCAVTLAGKVKCWGSNDSGQLGDGTFRQRGQPVDVEGVTGAKMIALGGPLSGDFGWACALTASGVKCWGKNFGGTLGVEGVVAAHHPIDVPSLESGVTAISIGGAHGCALTTEGAVKCWGSNDKGQLGDGTNVARSTPVAVSRLTSKVTAITARGDHTCALTAAGGVLCWGDNADGELGDGTSTARNAPAEVTGLASGVTAISAGTYDTCVLLASGAIECWGKDDNGQIGNKKRQRHVIKPFEVAVGGPAAAVSAGPLSTCAFTRAGAVVCWGHGGDRELGDGKRVDNLNTRVVELLRTGGTAALSVDKWHACDVTAIGGVKCWGMNTRGQIGDGGGLFSRAAVADVIVP